MDLKELSECLIADINELSGCCNGQKKEEALQRTGALMGRLATFLDLVFKTQASELVGFEAEVAALKDRAIPAIGNAFRALENGDLKLLGEYFGGQIKACLEALNKRASENGKDICFKTSAETASECVKSFKETSARTVLMFGGGDGTVIRELLKVLDPKSRIMVCEPLKSDFESLTGVLGDARVTVVDFSADPTLFRDELIRRVDYYSLSRMDVLAHPAYDSAFPGEYALFLRMINDNRERLLVNKNTMTRFRKEGALHVLKNIGAMSGAYLLSDLKNAGLQNIPVIIVSAGPSLDKNIEDLRPALGHAFIIAVDTALKYLLKKDIIPDAFVTIDPAKSMENFADERVGAIPVIFDEQTPPELLGKHTAAKILYNCRDYPKKLFEACGVKIGSDIPSGGSVATAAFAICYELGIKDIILIGQDLAYTGETTHAGGVISAGINGDIGTVMIDGIDGEKVRTRSDWIGYLRWFEHAIELIAHEAPDVSVIDATEGGALIRGTRVMTLREAISQTCGKAGREQNNDACLCNFTFDAVLSRTNPALDEQGREKFVKLHMDEIATLSALREDGERGFLVCEEISKKVKEELSKQYKSENKVKDELSKLSEIKKMAAEAEAIRKRCESRFIFPVINNYAVTFEAEQISKILEQKASANSDIARFYFDIEISRLAFKGVVSACEFLMRSI